MKYIFKYLGVSLLLICFSCNRDDSTILPEQEITNFNTGSTRIQETIDAANIPGIIEFISRQKVGLMSSLANGTRSAEDSEVYHFGDIDLDHIVALVNDEQADDKTYTFGISTPEFFDQWANLIIRVIDGEIIRAYINIYSPSPEYLEDVGLGFHQNFTGTMESFGLEDSGIDLNRSVGGKLGDGLRSLKSVSIIGGIAESITQSDECDNDTDDNNNDNNNNNNGNNGNGNNNDDGHDGTDHQDTTDGTQTDDGGTGGTGDGGVSVVICIEVENIGGCCNRNVCNPHPPATPYPKCTGVNAVIIQCGDASVVNPDGDDPLGGETASTRMSDCPNDDVIIINPFLNPCTNLTASINLPEVKQRLIALKNESTQSSHITEKGFTVRRHPTNGTTVTPDVEANLCSAVAMAITAITHTAVHTHPVECNGNVMPFGMFSGADIANLEAMFTVSQQFDVLGTSELTQIVIYNGSVFAIKFDDDTAALALDALLPNISVSSTPGEIEERRKAIDILNRKVGKAFSRTESLNNNQQNSATLQKGMLNFFAGENLDISLYKANFSGGQITWDKKVLNNNVLSSEPCTTN